MHRRWEETSDQAQVDPPITSGTHKTHFTNSNIWIDLSDMQ